MHGRAISDHVLKHWHFMKALIVFIFVTIYATNAAGWGWSRSPGQASSVSTPSNDTETTVSSGATSSSEAVNSSPMSQEIQQSTPTAPSQDVQDTETVANQAATDTANQDMSNSSNNNSDDLPVWKKRAKRKNLLVKKWRSEKSRKDVFYVTTDQPLNIPDVKFQLDRIQAEIPNHPENQLPYKGSDLALLEEWINDAINRRIPAQSKSEISKSTNSDSSVWNNIDVLKKIDSLERKRDMLVYGNNALQAMGIFVD